MNIKLLEAELMKLSPKEKAIITSKLLESLEEVDDENLKAVKRYNQLLNDTSGLLDSELVIKEAKSKYWSNRV